MKPRKDSADKGAGSGCHPRIVRCSSFSSDWLAISVYRHIILPWSDIAEKLFSRCRGHKRAGRALEFLAEVSSYLEVVTQSRLWSKHLGEGTSIKLMSLCRKKNPSITQVKARLGNRNWNKTRVYDLKPYAASSGGSQVIFWRDGDGYFVFGDGPSQIVDTKHKTRYTHDTSDQGNCKRDGVFFDIDCADVHINSSTNVEPYRRRGRFRGWFEFVVLMPVGSGDLFGFLGLVH